MNIAFVTSFRCRSGGRCIGARDVGCKVTYFYSRVEIEISRADTSNGATPDAIIEEVTVQWIRVQIIDRCRGASEYSYNENRPLCITTALSTMNGN